MGMIRNCQFSLKTGENAPKTNRFCPSQGAFIALGPAPAERPEAARAMWSGPGAAFRPPASDAKNIGPVGNLGE